MRALVLFTFASMGCWTDPPPRYASVQNVAPAPPVVSKDNSLPPHTVWTGRYECAQGVTAFQLTLDVEANDHARAIFDFGPLADNPTVPPGSYRMRGTATVGEDGISISLLPQEWIDRPDGYEMVGLVGVIDANRRRFQGRLLNTSCAWFDLKRDD